MNGAGVVAWIFARSAVLDARKKCTLHHVIFERGYEDHLGDIEIVRPKHKFAWGRLHRRAIKAVLLRPAISKHRARRVLKNHILQPIHAHSLGRFDVDVNQCIAPRGGIYGL